MCNRLFLLLVSTSIWAVLGCQDAAATGTVVAAESGTAAQEPAEPDAALAEVHEGIGRLLQPARRSWEQMVEDRVIRVLVAYSKTNFFLDGGRQRGITADALLEFEKQLNAKLKLGRRPMQVAAIPVQRDQLISLLEQGRGDVAAANLTVTPERSAVVDFSLPAFSNVRELVVTGPGAPSLPTLDDLAGQSVYIRASSSFRESIEALNRSFAERGLAPIEIFPMSEYLETEDLLEMTNAGLLPITVADEHVAQFWAQIFPEIRVREDLAVATGQTIAWAIRADAEGLKDQVDEFVRGARKGTLLGNMLMKRYFQNAGYIRNSLHSEDQVRFESMVELFRKYGDQYDFDPLMLAAQGYQESRLDQSVRSSAGAIGVMQVLQSTASDPAVGIPDVHNLESNIHAGTKYLQVLEQRYFNDPEIDEVNRTLFCFAGYNAGPNRIQRLRKQAAEQGLDPNLWFRNVEHVVAASVGREPVQYVSNIYKYYIAYLLVQRQQELRAASR